MNYYLLIASVVMFSLVPASFADRGIYNFKLDDDSFDVSYNFDGELLAIGIDQESTSLLIGTADVKESTFEISFPSELLSAEDSAFLVLVDGLETDYAITYSDTNPTLTFPIPDDTQEIEIIGTSVIPEFPLGALTIMGIVSLGVIIFSRTKLSLFK